MTQQNAYRRFEAKESDRYYRAFASILEELGIPCEKLPFESYLNPVIELPPEQGR